MGKIFRFIWARLSDISLAKDLAIWIAGPTLVTGAVGAILAFGAAVWSGLNLLSAFALAVLFAIGFMVAWILYLELQRRRIRKQPPKLPQKVSLLTLYATDHLQGTTSTLQVDLTVGERDQWKYRFCTLIVCQYDSHAKYLSVYLPESTDLKRVKYACYAIAKDMEQLLEQKVLKTDLRRLGGNAKVTYQEMRFTGLINIYHEDFFPSEVIAQIENMFRLKNVAAHFFGTDYASSVSQNIKAGITPPRPEYELIDGVVRKVGSGDLPLAKKGLQSFEMEPGESLSLKLPPITAIKGEG